ncbi:DUF2232 domain-containing protein [Clostridium sp. Cult2]|uniref:DUF2232 domain-containing protein n=1 Tax=Clostridium sp. Cult2 TaxID=2079003 RepID=UPI001F29AFE8|nr:DUF2232 domain-containing protein [Clostridium sp. Cult2]
MDLKNKTMETVFAIAISTILMLIGIYYLELVIFLYPVLFVMLGIRYGINYAVLGLIISSFSLGLMVDMISGVFIFIGFTPLTISLIYTMKMRKNAFTVLSISTMAFLLSILFIISIMKNMAGVSIINQLEEFFTQILNYQVEVLKDTELSNYQILKVEDFLENAYDYIILIIPSILMIFSLITAYLNFLLSSLSLRRLGYGIVSIPKFSRFKLPNNILLGTGIMFLGTFILKKVELIYYETVLLNITVIITFLFFTQGLSVIDHMLIKRNIKLILRILIVIVFTIIIPLGWIIPIIGVFDTIFDIRKFRKSA